MLDKARSKTGSEERKREALEGPRGAGGRAERAQPTRLAGGARAGCLLRREHRLVRVAPAGQYRPERCRIPNAPIREPHRLSTRRHPNGPNRCALWTSGPERQ